MAITQQTHTTDMEEIAIRREQIAEIRWHKGRAAITPTKAFRAAGLSSRGAWFPVEDSIGNYGILVAQVVPIGPNEPAPDGAIPIYEEGAGEQPALTTRIPNEYLEPLGFDLEAVRAGERPKITVWSGNGYIAVEHNDSRTLEVPDRGPGNEFLELDSHQDVLFVWEETGGDLEKAAEIFAVDEETVHQRFVEAGLIDEDDE